MIDDLELIQKLEKLRVDGANYEIYSSKNFVILMFYIKRINTIAKYSIYISRNRITNTNDNILNLRKEVIEELCNKIENNQYF